VLNYLKKILQNFHHDQRGHVLISVLVLGSIAFTIIVTGIVSYAIMENRASNFKHNREMAFQIAEAGINYYRWHLAHNKTDYKDGTDVDGPYVHAYEDKDGNVIGHYSLDIIAPLSGSTVVTIDSTGWLDAQPDSKRKLRARVGFPALTDYAFLTNTDVWIGDTEYTHGKFHANGGIRYDGVGDAPITSVMATYTCKIFHGCGNQTQEGIWGAGGPQEYWRYPVPAKDFTAVTAKLAEIKEGADEGGGLYLTSSGDEGWRLSFQADGTVKVYKVTRTYCYSGKDMGDNKYHTYCIDIRSTGSATTYPIPANGYIYVEDMVWVDGVVNGRATIGTAVGKSIIINGNITYLAKDGNHVLGLIGEKDILIPHNSPDYLEIDAALLAKSGATKRYFYAGDTKESLTTFGSVITFGIWTWSWTSGGGEVVSGYEITNSTYDVNLTYNPPPGFPVGSEYNLISWEEVEVIN